MGDWQLLGDIKLRAALCNIGCFPVSRNEVLLFGGIDSQAREVKQGVVLLSLNGTHSYLENGVDLLVPDFFSNSTQVHVDEVSKKVLVQGKHAIHKLDLSNALKRQFSIAFEHEQ